MSELPILSISIVLPLLSAVYITFFVSHSSNREVYAMYVAILGSVLTLISTIFLIARFDKGCSSFQFVERYSWLPKIGLEFYVGVDGIAIFFIFLTALLTLICIIASLFTVKKQIKEFLLCFLLLESFCIGVFSSLNLLLFYLFFEITLIPLYIIIGVWGAENRIYAALKFFLYTFWGSVFFLLSLIFIYTKTYTFSIPDLMQLTPAFPLATQKILWFATFITFAVKVPMLPFHTWLPDAHVQAPTAGSVVLAGILLKLGGYAFIRISLPLFTGASRELAIYVIAISVFAIIYASLVAFAQKDMKKMIAYSSIAHMGYVTGGIFSFTSEGLKGAVFQMFSHGLISSALFLIVGVLYERNHTKQIDQYGGVAGKMPIFATLFMICMLGSIGLPGSSGFIGEFLIIVGVFKVNVVMGTASAVGIILGALYMLRLYKDLMLGPVVNKAVAGFKDLYLYEILALAPLVMLIIYLGIAPETVLKFITTSVDEVLKTLER